MPPASSPWTDERCERLRQLWADGLSASEIAEQLGATRSGVLGKVMRLHLTHRRSSEFKPGPPRPPKARRPVVSPSPPPPEPEKKPHMRRLQLHQLQDDHCRWPYGDPMRRPFYFCGADTSEGRVYCDYHFARAFVRSKR